MSSYLGSIATHILCVFCLGLPYLYRSRMSRHPATAGLPPQNLEAQRRYTSNLEVPVSEWKAIRQAATFFFSVIVFYFHRSEDMSPWWPKLFLRFSLLLSVTSFASSTVLIRSSKSWDNVQPEGNITYYSIIFSIPGATISWSISCFVVAEIIRLAVSDESEAIMPALPFAVVGIFAVIIVACLYKPRA
ncbi:hypothetical protein AX17_007438 [Amanita inopinata Kibby_2008]|nr:hypothetical protein AX17_007438 [Amanita inopinata Kibby_2008]